MPWYTLGVSITANALHFVERPGGFSEEEATKATRGYYAMVKQHDYRIVAARIV